MLDNSGEAIKFRLTGEMTNKPPSAPAPAIRKGWAECPAQPTMAGDPESGC